MQDTEGNLGRHETQKNWISVTNLVGRKTGSFQPKQVLRNSYEMWLIMTENIFPNCISISSVKPIDNEAMKGNRCHVFQELITVLRCSIHHKDLSLSLPEQESNIKISIRKYRVVSLWEEIKARNKESRARITFYNTTCIMLFFC